MPAVLNVDFIDSPMVESTAGEVGGEPFLWQLLRGDQKVDTVTTEIQEERLAPRLGQGTALQWRRESKVARCSALLPDRVSA